jgi:hypothetical protein
VGVGLCGVFRYVNALMMKRKCLNMYESRLHKETCAMYFSDIIVYLLVIIKNTLII